jgi:hypothetical protein
MGAFACCHKAAMMVLGFSGVGFMAYRRKSKAALMAA